MKKIIIAKLLFMLLSTISKFTKNTVDDNIAQIGDLLITIGQKLSAGNMDIEPEIKEINLFLKGIK